MCAKRQLKHKFFFPGLKRLYLQNRCTIIIALFLLIFPFLVGAAYRIPIHLVDVPIGDSLSFYAVALGVFASYQTYINNERRKSLEKQEALRPSIELALTLDNEAKRLQIMLNNPKGKDYSVTYLGIEANHVIDDIFVQKPLNAKDKTLIVANTSEGKTPERLYVGVKDEDGYDWQVTFEYLEETSKYCRISIDAL